MSQISQKSISGITSITTPAGVDNQFTLHTNNTSEALKLDHAGNIHIHNHVNTTGISSASNFKTGSSNLHSTGLNVQDLDVDGHTNLDNVSIAGFTTCSGGLKMVNSAKLRFGNNNNSYIYYDAGSGVSHFQLTGGNLSIASNVSNSYEYMIRAFTNNRVELYYDGSEKIRTTAKGIEVGAGTTIETNGQATYTGIVTATAFHGDGSDLTNLPAGLGTALSATASSPLNKMYYTNQVLGVPSSVTVDVPESASKAYTQYADIKVESSADLIIAEGDDLIPDVLGLADFGTFGGGASAGRIRVNSISNAANDGSPTVQKGLVVTGVCTATSFAGDGSALTGITQTTINNNADNRIITGSGTANTLNGESDLTWQGNTLTIGSNVPNIRFEDSDGTDYAIQVNTNLFKIVDTDNGNRLGFQMGSDGNTQLGGNTTFSGDLIIPDVIRHNGDSNTKIRFPEDDKISFETGGTERLRIDNVGVLYTGNYTTTLDATPGSIQMSGGTSGARLSLRGTTTSAYGGLGEIHGFWDANKVASILFHAGADTTNKDDGEIRMYTRTSGGASDVRFKIDSNGHVTTPYTVSFFAQGMSGSSYNNGTMTGSGNSGTSHNIGNHYNGSTGIFTAPVSGRYLCGCGVLVQSGTGRLEGRIYKNNSDTIAQFNGTGSTYDGPTATVVVQLAANDNLRINRQSGSAYTPNHGNHYFFAHLIG